MDVYLCFLKFGSCKYGDEDICFGLIILGIVSNIVELYSFFFILWNV